MQTQERGQLAVSAYTPAPLQARIIASLIDGVVYAVLNMIGAATFGVGSLASIGYYLIRDGLFDGRSVGKKVMNLRVVNVDATILTE